MVAYTSPDCLPYFQCSDSPCLNTGTVCEPSTVFCDLVSLLDLKFTGFDDTLRRTAVAVPIFKIARTAQQVFDTNVAGFSDQIIWDTVVVDNENMVDLDADPLVARINRPGLWEFELYVYGFPPRINGNTMNATLDNGSTLTYNTVTSSWRSGQPNTYLRLGYTREITQASLTVSGPTPFGASVGFSGTTDTGLITIQHAELTGWWYGEEVP